MQYVYYFSPYQKQRSLHGDGVITELYFAIFCAIYGMNDLESRSEVIQGHRFWYQPKAHISIPISGQ